MAYLYLFIVDSVCKHDKNSNRNYAIITNKKGEKLHNLKEHEFTNCFNELGIEKDVIIYKKIIEFDIDIYDNIVNSYKDNSDIVVYETSKMYYCCIDNNIINIKNNNLNIDNIYKFVGIYK